MVASCPCICCSCRKRTPFSCRYSQNVTDCRKEICSTCLFKTYIPAVPFWNSNHLLPTRSRFLRATVRSTSSALWLHHAHPFVAAEEKKAVSCREAEGLVTESDMLLWLQGHLSWHLAKSSEAMNNCRDSASGQGWRRGCQPFSCRCSLNVMHCRKEIYGTCLSKESMPFVKSKPPLPTVPEAWGPWEPQHPPPSHYGCIMLAKDRVVVSKIWTTGYWLWSWLFCICDCWKSMKNCRDSSLSLRGLEARLPAFQLPMFAKCDALKEICSTCLSNGIHAFCEI